MMRPLAAAQGESPTMMHRPTIHVSVLFALTIALGAGCGGEKETAAPAPADSAEVAVAPAAAAPSAPAAEKTKVIEGADPTDERFTVKIDPPADAAVGAEAKVKITIVPKDPWHMNLDFPTSLAVRPPDGVTLAKAEQKKEDVLRLDESGCEYEVGFTPSAAGEKSFTGKLKFAVCQDEACAPVTKDVEFRVAVK